VVKNPEFKLNTGADIPSIGFGTWKILPAKKAVKEALAAGYRLIDTARIYGNERGVGKAIRESGIAREDIFLTTKLWNSSQGYDKALDAFDKSLDRLRTDYADLYLIHWPVTDKREESWKALEKINKSRRARAIGVSNYTVRHLEELLADCDIVPAVNQVEFHPFLYEEQKELLAYCKGKGILVEAYSPLAHGQKTDTKVTAEIARKYGKSSQQVILRWCIQHGTVPLPKSTDSAHIASNLDILDFELTDSEMERINGLSDGTRTCWNPNDMA
jgi:diketogulonate reductase-like aldo/keto reductase